MWRRWLERLERTPADAHPPRDVAMAVLLLECARADFEHHDIEHAALREVLGSQLQLAAHDIERLLGDAARAAGESVSLHGPVSRINAELSPQDKRALLGWLWQVACADGRVDPHEEHLLRRLADLMHLSHADYIRAKLNAQGGTP